MVKVITLDIDPKLWEAWKNTIPREVKLNDALVNLIKVDLLETRSKNNIESEHDF